jgi:hypothetical protein
MQKVKHRSSVVICEALCSVYVARFVGFTWREAKLAHRRICFSVMYNISNHASIEYRSRFCGINIIKKLKRALSYNVSLVSGWFAGTVTGLLPCLLHLHSLFPTSVKLLASAASCWSQSQPVLRLHESQAQFTVFNFCCNVNTLSQSACKR